jgi:hypothetical protein
VSVAALLATVGWGETYISFVVNCANRFSCGSLGCSPCAARHHWVLASGIGEWLVVMAAALLFLLGRRRAAWLRITTRATAALLPVAIIWYLATTWVAWS